MLNTKPVVKWHAVLTCIIDYPSLCPMLDYHSKRPHTGIDLDIRFDHAGILKSKRIVDIHVACKIELGVQYLDDWDFCI